MPFSDRTEAGRRLADALAAETLPDPVVLALPRGGVPVGAEIAERLGCPLDLVLVRKIGAPGQEELAVAAVADSGPDRHLAVNEEIRRALGLDRAWIEAQADEKAAENRRRRQSYLGTRQRMDLAGRTAIVVDDGVATGATTRVALEAVRAAGAGAGDPGRPGGAGRCGRDPEPQLRPRGLPGNAGAVRRDRLFL